MFHRICLTVIFLTLVFSLSMGDVIYLKNGGRLEGTVIKKTDSKVIVDLGFGETDIDLSEIDRIKWSKSGKVESLEKKAPSPTMASPKVAKSVPSLHIKETILFHGPPGNKAGTFCIGEARRDSLLFVKTTLAPKKFTSVPLKADVGVYYPMSFKTGKKWPLLIVMGPGIDMGIGEINAYVPLAEQLGMVVAACELVPELDTEEGRFYYIYNLIEYLKFDAIIDEKALWIAGLSGGGQWAMQLGVLGGTLFSGIIAINCNYDCASIGYADKKDPTYLSIPMVLINSTQDKTANPTTSEYKSMLTSLKSTGFKRVKSVQYTSSAPIPMAETEKAFRWFISLQQ